MLDLDEVYIQPESLNYLHKPPSEEDLVVIGLVSTLAVNSTRHA